MEAEKTSLVPEGVKAAFARFTPHDWMIFGGAVLLSLGAFSPDRPRANFWEHKLFPRG